jgi:drug/metabolite transporter (DMT)-like permease
MKNRTPFLLLLLGAIWGASFLFIKIGVTEMGPLTFAMLRVLIGSLGLLVAIRLSGQRIPTDRQTWQHFAVMGIVGISFPFAAISWGTQYIPSGLSAILNASMPLFTAVLAAGWGDERLTLHRVGGVMVGLSGIFILTLPSLQDGLLQGLAQTSLLGELAIVLASLSYAVAVVYARHYLINQPPLIASLGQVSTGWLFLLPFALMERPWIALPTPRGLAAVAALGVFGTSIAYIIYYRLLQTAGATATSLVTYIVPVFGVFWGWAILGERIGSNAFIALALILGGVVLVARPARPRPVEGQNTSATCDLRVRGGP